MPPFLRIVNHFIRAPLFFDDAPLLGRAGRANDAAAERFGNLDSGEADAARSGVYEDPVVWLGEAAVDDAGV